MDNKPGLVYFIDSNDIIVRFYSHIKAPVMDESLILGKSFFDIIHSPELEVIFRAIFSEVRSGKVFTTYYRCDTSQFKRRFKLVTEFSDGLLVLKHFLISEEPLDANVTFVEKNGELLRMCAWCNKFHVEDNGWLELEEALSLLGIFEEVKISPITHGICEACSNKLREEVGLLGLKNKE